jgi:hypothetical protein
MGYFLIGILTGGVMVYVLVDRRIRAKLNSRADGRSRPLYQGMPDQQCAEPVSTVSFEELRAAAGNEFSSYARRFEGLYERLYQAAQGGTPDKAERVLQEWERKLMRFDLPAALAVWKVIDSRAQEPDKSRQRAGDWLSMLFSWGVQRDSVTEVPNNESTAILYSRVDAEEDTAAAPPEKLQVMVPCWTWGNSVVERGAAHAPYNAVTRTID